MTWSKSRTSTRVSTSGRPLISGFHGENRLPGASSSRPTFAPGHGCRERARAGDPNDSPILPPPLPADAHPAELQASLTKVSGWTLRAMRVVRLHLPRGGAADCLGEIVFRSEEHTSEL